MKITLLLLPRLAEEPMVDPRGEDTPLFEATVFAANPLVKGFELPDGEWLRMVCSRRDVSFRYQPLMM